MCISIGHWVSCQQCVGERQKLLTANHFAVCILGLWVGNSFFYLFLFCSGIPGIITAEGQQLFINFLEIDGWQISS